MGISRVHDGVPDTDICESSHHDDIPSMRLVYALKLTFPAVYSDAPFDKSRLLNQNLGLGAPCLPAARLVRSITLGDVDKQGKYSVRRIPFRRSSQAKEQT